MNKKILSLIIVLIILIVVSFGVLNFSNSDNANNTSVKHDLKGEKINLNGYTCMIPESYQNGNSSNQTGISIYGTDNGTIYVTVYNNDEDGDYVHNGDMSYFAYGENNVDNNPKIENITVDGHDILYVIQHSDIRGDYRLAFFTVNDKRVLIEWLGNDINDDVKNIINSFYELN